MKTTRTPRSLLRVLLAWRAELPASAVRVAGMEYLRKQAADAAAAAQSAAEQAQARTQANLSAAANASLARLCPPELLPSLPPPAARIDARQLGARRLASVLRLQAC